MMSSTKSLSLTVARRAPEPQTHARGEGDLGDFQTLKLDIEVLRSAVVVNIRITCHFHLGIKPPSSLQTSLLCLMVCSSQADVLNTFPLVCGTL